MAVRFLDTNVLIRYLSRDDEAKARQALDLLLRVEQGRERVATSPLFIFETVFTLQKSFALPRQQIQERVMAIISLRNLHLPDKHLFERAFEIYVEYNVSFADAYNAAYMNSRNLDEIYSWDREFDRIRDLTRIEP